VSEFETSLRFVNDRNNIPEHVAEEADRLGFWPDTGVSKSRLPDEPCYPDCTECSDRRECLEPR
jgi:hypothetical protein